jgi:hypothetical protein
MPSAVLPPQRFNPLTMKKPKRSWETMKLNNDTFLDYMTRLQEIAISMFEWAGLPDTVDERFLELTLCEYGYLVYFDDEEIGNLVATAMIGGPLDIYRVPINRRAYANNGYQKDLTNQDSVLVYNNYLHTPSMLTILLYARRLYEIERTIDINVKAQKTPVAIICDESQLFTMKQVYEKFDGNEPIVFGAKNLDLRSIQSLKTDAPFVADKLNTLKKQIWNEAMTIFGVENANTEKKERLVSDEVLSSLGTVQAQRYVMLNSRRQAAKQINKMFGTNIEVNFRQDFSALNTEMPTTTTMHMPEDYVESEVENSGRASGLGG